VIVFKNNGGLPPTNYGDRKMEDLIKEFERLYNDLPNADTTDGPSFKLNVLEYWFEDGDYNDDDYLKIYEYYENQLTI
jgi:hypothetical protein